MMDPEAAAGVCMVGQGVLSELDSAPDVLINNAGVSEGGGVPLWEVEKEVWDNVLGVNVHGTSTLPRPALLCFWRARGLLSYAVWLPEPAER